MKGTRGINLKKTTQGPQAARSNATCCVPKGDGLPSCANMSMSVDIAARVSTLKNALHIRKDETVKQQLGSLRTFGRKLAARSLASDSMLQT